MLIQKILLAVMLMSAIWYICSLVPELMQAAEKCELE